jgi:IS5 family transposase
MAGQPGFFDAEERLRWLSASGDPLERLRAVVDFEAFRAELEAALPRADRSRGGRPPWDAVLMFRVLVLQALYTLSDDQTEYQLRDRLSFMRFVGLALQDAVPDAKTIWLYREQLTRAGALAKLFARFDAMLAERGFLAMGGQIVDATVVEARRPRLTKDEKQTLRDGGTPEGWSKARTRQIDRDGPLDPQARPQGQAARRHAAPGRDRDRGADVRLQEPPRRRPRPRVHPPLRRHRCRTARRRPARRRAGPANTGGGVWADTAYRSKANLELLDRRGLRPEFQRAKPRGRPMPAHIARGNATRARVRSLVEHVFAVEKRGMRLVVRCVGLVRATARITLANLAYNMRRLAWIEGRTASA